MRRGRVLFGFWFAGFLPGIAAYEVAMNLLLVNSSPPNPEFVGAFVSGLVGSFAMLIVVSLSSRLGTRGISIDVVKLGQKML